jgi:hypothetical protein
MQPQRPISRRRAWEFISVLATEALLTDQQLDSFGLERWELISVVPISDDRYYCRFRRERISGNADIVARERG